MNTNILIGILVGVVLIGGGWWYMSGNQGSQQGNGAVDMLLGAGTLADLVKLGKSLTCTITSKEGNEFSSGTVYVAGDRFRGDFATTGGESGPEETHVINANGFIYLWGSSMEQGIKMTVPPETTSPDTESTQPRQMPSDIETYTEAPVDYSCAPWIVSDEKFTPPADVSFFDFSAGLEDLMQGLPALPPPPPLPQ